MISGRATALPPLLAIPLVVLSAGSSEAQDAELNADPSECYLGQEVRVFGFVKPAGGHTSADLTFTPPGAPAAITERVQAEPNGDFEFVFTQTDQVGTWKVRVRGSAGGTAETQFLVSATIFLVPLVSGQEEAAALAHELAQEFKTTVGGYPDFPEKPGLDSDLDELAQQATEIEAQLAQAEQATQDLEEALQEDPAGIPDSVKSELRAAAAECVRARREIERQLPLIREFHENALNETNWCAHLKWWHEGFQQLNFLNLFVGNSLKAVAGNLRNAAAMQGLDPALQIAIGATLGIVGYAAGGGVLGLTMAVVSTLTSVGNTVLGALIKKHCQVYEGKAEGTYHTAVLHGNEPFFEMTYRLEADVWLIFEARKPGDPTVYLSGEFAGRVHGFESSMTMVPFGLPTALPLAWSRNPVPLLGSRSFLHYLEGKAQDDLMELKLERAGSDFKLKAQGFYVMAGDQTLIPIPGMIEFPLMNAEWFLTRVTKTSDPTIEYFELPITIANGNSVARCAFDREIFLPETDKRKGVRINMSLEMELSAKK